MVAYVVDSNCFIHMGGMATTTILNDLKSALKTMHVTNGVHGEIQNVRYQRWKNKPNLLNHIKPLLTTHEISDDQIRGLGAKIGERASPQDVDLSLMVLAYDMQREGHHVVLVTDDFKMAKATEEHQLANEVCPPSTFLNDFQPRRKENMLQNCVDLDAEFVPQKCSMLLVEEMSMMYKPRSLGWSIPCSQAHLRSALNLRLIGVERQALICLMN